MSSRETASTLSTRRNISMHVNTDSNYLNGHEPIWKWCPDSAHYDSQQSVKAIDNLSWLNDQYRKQLAELKQRGISESGAVDSLRSQYADRLFQFRLDSCLATRETIMKESKTPTNFAVT